MTQFTLNTEFHTTQEFIDQVKNGWVRIPVSVVGYWSSDVITLRMSHSFEKEFKLELSHSSGGRDTNVVKSDLVAEANFGAALVATAEYGQFLESNLAQYEAMYQEEAARKQAEYEIERAEKQAKIDADAPLGEFNAKKLVSYFKTVPNMVIAVYNRGAEKPSFVKIVQTRGGSQKFEYGYRKLTREQLVELLAESSNRTMIGQPVKE